VPDIGHLQASIARFNSRHDVTEDHQFKMLCEEVGELAAVLNTDTERYEVAEAKTDSDEYVGFSDSDDRIAEELADVIFVARSLAEIRDINITDEVHKVTQENLQKDESTMGQKVTKTKVSKPSYSYGSTGTKPSDTSYGVTDD